MLSCDSEPSVNFASPDFLFWRLTTFWAGSAPLKSTNKGRKKEEREKTKGKKEKQNKNRKWKPENEKEEKKHKKKEKRKERRSAKKVKGSTHLLHSVLHDVSKDDDF